jgi:hypothetical protein
VTLRDEVLADVYLARDLALEGYAGRWDPHQVVVWARQVLARVDAGSSPAVREAAALQAAALLLVAIETMRVS